MNSPTQLPRILIVDESRIVRATISKHVRDLYDYREESDGEAAWQVLVLDHSIALVICSLSLPVLDGNGLLDRVRSSRLARLAQMPMLMIAGDNDEAIERAKAHGASDFISRGTGGAELLARIDSQLKLVQAQHQLKENLEQNVQNPETGLFTRKYVELQAVQAMSHAMRHNNEVSAMVMSFDNIGALREEHGVDVAKQLQQRFISMLSSKIRKEDSLGHYAGSQLVVISPGTPAAACESFGNRLREAIRTANIAVHGQRLNLSVSVGVSNSPADAVVSGGALIELAGSRLKMAQQAGGNQVISCNPGADAVSPVAPALDQALALINEGQVVKVMPHLAALGLQVMPLLRLLERRFGLGLPLAEIEKRMTDPVQEKEDAGQD
ncbi:MAG: diguanylate cyclase [Propionivibrio sp.]|jgi:two-component system cell cycle response regulator|uniref:diguanylate cyclase n=1 Tax=Propionivibrio sp. TaxID=2212460 RepID=UPI001B689882|nr:diguanylate cyclase [Propionivibrio sp.]MBP7203936.1 diguanylate cyclase [Propionivibrio sp.]